MQSYDNLIRHLCALIINGQLPDPSVGTCKVKYQPSTAVPKHIFCLLGCTGRQFFQCVWLLKLAECATLSAQRPKILLYGEYGPKP